MLFTGYSEHTVDTKLRLAVPAKYRNLWSPERDGQAWVCVPWPGSGSRGGHLRLYTETAFAAMAEQTPSTLTPDPDTADLEASLFSLAERLEMDGAGRIVLPKQHMELTGMTSEVAVIGARNRLEVHDLPTWKQRRTDGFKSLPELVQRIQARGGPGTGGSQTQRPV